MQLEALSKVLWGIGGENDFDFMLLEGSWQEGMERGASLHRAK